MGQAHVHLLVMQSRGVPCIRRGTGQGHSARSPSCAKKWADCSPGKFFCVCNCIFLLCLLLGARWHHDCTFLLLLGMWQTQDADSQFVTSYMIAFPRSWAYHYILINAHCWNEIKLMGRNGSYSLPFMMKVMVWYSVNDTHKVMTHLFLSCLFWFGQEWRKVVAFKIFLWSSFCNLIDNSVSFFMFLSDTKILLQLQFSCCTSLKIVECYGGWRLLQKWHASAEVYTLLYAGLRFWAYCLYTLPFSGWFYLWSRGEELASLKLPLSL
jgi:hypothetical protein